MDSLAEPRAVRRAVRLGLGLIVLLGLVRAAAFLVYARATLPTPLEAHFLEAKMVHLAWRVREGLTLYPDWRGFPYVSNFYSPGYFLLVGGLGRLAGAGLDELFFIGRGVTFASALLTTAALGWLVGRRHGRWAGLASATVSLGATPMIGFAVMVRSDLLAELLGLVGFVLSRRRSRGWCALGCILLVAAALTKQTAGVFLLARAIALYASGRRARAAAVLAGGLGLLGAIVAGVTIVATPTFLSSLLGESRAPLDLPNAVAVTRRIVLTSPDLLAFPLMGLAFWARGRPRDVDAIVLTLVLLATGCGTVVKRGSDANYFLNLRIPGALAVGTIWASAHAADPRARRRGILASYIGAVALAVGALNAVAVAESVRRIDAFLRGSTGRAHEASFRALLRVAEDPGIRLLTDSGLVDVHQKERTAFGDPFLFRYLVNSGQIAPTRMEEWIESESYDLIVTHADLDSDGYASYAFGLPMVLVERARRHYVRTGMRAGLFVYGRRGAVGDGRRPR